MTLTHVSLALCAVALVACAGEAAVPPAAPAPVAAASPAPPAPPRGWEALATLSMHGTIATGGLSGPIEAVTDVRTGRWRNRFKLGPIDGAEGFDGRAPWEKDLGGEITTLDAPESQRHAATAAWMNRLGFHVAAYERAAPGAPVEPRTDAGRAFRVMRAEPEGGAPVELWFDAAAGVLARSVERRGTDHVTTVYDDYREQAGVRLPMHQVSDSTDGAGRPDPRAHVDLRFERAEAGAPLGDAEFAPPAMAATSHIDDPSGVTRVPFELVNNHIYVDATIGGQRVHVLVDTGGSNVLVPAAARRLGLAAEGKLSGGGVGDERVDVGVAHARDVRVGAAVLDSPMFAVVDLGPLREVEGVEFDGLVGFEMFRRFRVTVDYAARTLVIAMPAKFQPPEGAHVLPFDMSSTIPIVRATLDGLPVRVSIDTGSRSSLSMNSPFVREHGLAERYAAAPERVTGWGVGGPARGRPVRMGTLSLGDLVIHDVAGDLMTRETGALANPDLAGNLGGGVLRRFTVAFDYDAKRMYLAPGPEAGKPDPFDRSGLWLMGDGDALKVAAVAPSSAAEAARVAVGERVLRIDGEPVGKRSLAVWRARLAESAAGTRVALDLDGAGGKRKVTLKLADAIPDHARVK